MTRAGWLGGALRWQSRVAVALAVLLCGAALGGVPLGAGVQYAVLLGGMVLVGVPHGAFDHLVVRPLLQPRLGHRWWVPFNAAYLGLAGLIGLAWWLVPAPMTAVFLAASVVHFGLGDREDGLAPAAVPRWAAVLVYGAVPVLLPVALHPDAAAPVLAGLADVPDLAMVDVLRRAVWLMPVWAGAFAGVLWLAWRQGLGVAERLLTAAAFILLPPLLAFGLYFSAGHAMRHVLRLGAWHAPNDGRAAARWLAWTLLPAAAATSAVIGALVWWGTDSINSVLVPVFRIIAALTFPHMIVTAYLEQKR